jgi:hypothetical protein
VFLGAKLEEVQRRGRDVINVFYRIERRRERKPLDLLDMFGKARARSASVRIDARVCASALRADIQLRARSRYIHKHSRFTAL